jgi:hypothetical protein
MSTILIASKDQAYQVGYNESKMRETSILPTEVLELSI